MEEVEVPDFDTWLETYQPPEVEFVAVYDKDTGMVKAVGPSSSWEHEEHVLQLEKELAHQILEGKISIHSCFVDIASGTLEIAEVKSIFKIDDVIHRIISKEWSEIEKPDVYLTYNNSKKSLKIELSEEYGGTHKLSQKSTPRKIRWNGDTIMNFLITDYNDPNVLYKMVSVKISDLMGKSKTIKNIEVPTNKFSVYTRRLFKNYVIEYK